MSHRSRFSALGIAALACLTAQGSFGSEPLSLELIMSNPAWIGATPENPYWSVDGKSIYFEQPRAEDDFNDLLRLTLNSEAEPVLIDGSDWGTIDVAQRDFSADRRRSVFERNGDLFIRSVDGELTQLTRTSARESRPLFLDGDQSIVFRRGEQFFIRDLNSGLEHQPVDLRAEDDPDDEQEPDGFLDLQQSRLFEVVRDQKARADRREARNKARREADPTAPPKPIYLGKETTILNGELSPDGRFLVLLTTPAKPAEGRGDHMPSFVSADGYVEIRDVRPKVGTIPEPNQKLIMIDAQGAEASPIDLSVLPGISEDPLADLKAAQKEKESSDSADQSSETSDDGATAKDEKAEEKKAEARAVEVEILRWSPSGEHLAIQVHSYDNKDRWIAVTDGGGELKTIHHLHLDSWINWSYNELGWLDDNRLWFLSEESGWSQLYLHRVDSGKTERLSRGDTVVSNPTPSPDHRYIYFTANPEHPGQYDTFRVEVETVKIEQVSSLGGRTTFELSPTGQHLLLQHSSLLRPTELYLLDTGSDANAASPEPRRLTHTVSEKFAAIDWVEPQIVGVPSSHHDRPIYSRFYPARNPERLRGEDGKVPAVLFVHGAGYLQNAHKGFSGYFRELMFHTWLAEHGYHVLDMDYRASAGYGVDWRTAIYRQMGTPELEDLKDGVAWLVANHDVDVERAGVYGGSYGGFMTMMALFKEPELFAAGAALRPVTDWAHYNHPYTSNILNTPDVDPQAYARSSPIEFADGLQNHLLICAPMLDDNVFFQDTVRLAQRFIELGQTNFEVALYPVEPHGFRRPSSWLDEYRRIFRLFEQKLTP